MAGKQSELETLFVTFVGKDEQLEAAFKRVKARAVEVAKEVKDAIGSAFTADAFDTSQLDAAFQKIHVAAEKAAAAVATVVDAQASQVATAKTAAQDVSRSVTAAVNSAAEAATTAATATAKVAGVGAAAVKAGEDIARGAEEATQGGKDFAKWAADLQKNIDKVGKDTATAADYAKAFMHSLEGIGTEAEVAAAQQKFLNQVVGEMSDQMRNVRSAFINGRMSQAEFVESTTSLKRSIAELQDGMELTTKQQLKLNIASATGERGLAGVRGEASRLGLAYQVNLSLAQNFGTQLRQLGPAGAAAGQALGFLQNSLSGLQRPMTAADFSLGKLGMTLFKLPQLIGLASAAITAGLAVALYKTAVSAAETAEKIDKAAQSAGFTAEAFQEVAYALEQSGVSLDQTRQGLNDFNARLGQAAAGSRSIADAYRRLGVDIRDTNGAIRSGEEVFTDLVGALSRVESAAEQAATGGLVFGEEFSRRVIPALNRGKDGFNELRKQARDLGLILSGDSVQSLVQFRNEMTTVRKQIETARIEITAAFLPALRQVLIPLLQNVLVPALQNAAKRVGEFTQKFLDQSPAGVEFRREMIKNIEPLLRFGDVVIGIGQGFVAFGQLVIGTAAGVGAGLGVLSVQAETFAAKMSSVGEGLAWWQQGNVLGAIEIWKRVGKAAVEAFDPNEIGRAFEDAAGRYLDASFDSASSAQDRLVRALSGDYSGIVEGLSSTLANAANSGASALNGLGDAAEDAVGKLGNLEDLAPAGSLARLRQELAAAQKDFEDAVTDEARLGAVERIRMKEAEIAAISAMLSTQDPFKDARVWTTRLAAELEFGIKSAAEVFDLINPRIEQLREEAAAALKNFGFDSREYQEALGKIRVLEDLLSKVTSGAKTLTVDVKAVVSDPVDLVSPQALAALTPVMQRFLELLAQPTEAATAAFRTSFNDWVNNVELGLNQANSALNANAEKLRVWMDTVQAMDASGASLQERMAALAKSPFAGAVMGGPGDPGETDRQLGLIEQATQAQADAWAALQQAMTEEQIAEGGRRYAAATAEVKRLEALYQAADVTPDFNAGRDARQQLNIDLAAATRSLVLFGRENEVAATSLGLVETAIKRILTQDPTANVDDLTATWTVLNNTLGETADSGTDLTVVLANLAKAQGTLAQLTGTAPSKWDELRNAFTAAKDAALLTDDQLKALLETVGKLEKVDAATEALNKLAGDINLGTGIAKGLTDALAGIRDGDLQGALGGLTQLGAAIGTLIGGPAVGAVVQAIGQGLQAAVGLFQVIGDLFTGDSPARRKLRDTLSNTVAGAFRTGILDGLRGAEGWQENLHQNVKEAVLGALVDAFIQAAVMQAIFAPFIDTFTKILNSQGVDAAFKFFDEQFEGFWNSAMQVVEGFITRGQQYFKQADQTVKDAQGLTPGRFDLPTASVTVLAAPQWALELGTAAQQMNRAGEAMLTAAQMMQATFTQGIPVTTQSTRGIDAQRAL